MSLHIMLDLETMGRAPGCGIVSVGAVPFDPLGKGVTDQFYRNVSLQSCLDAGLTLNADSLLWWSCQTVRARRALTENPRPEPLKIVIDAFKEWFGKTGAKKIWSHGAPFDLPILQAAHAAVGVETPWDYPNARDTRTVFDLAGGIKIIRKGGTHHNALDDAIAQAQAVQRAYKKLGVKLT